MPVPNVPLAGGTASVEAFEQMIELARIEAGSVVGDRDVQAVRSTRACDENRPVRRRVMRGVLEHVRQRDRGQSWIDLDSPSPRPRPLAAHGRRARA